MYSLQKDKTHLEVPQSNLIYNQDTIRRPVSMQTKPLTVLVPKMYSWISSGSCVLCYSTYLLMNRRKYMDLGMATMNCLCFMA